MSLDKHLHRFQAPHHLPTDNPHLVFNSPWSSLWVLTGQLPPPRPRSWKSSLLLLSWDPPFYFIFLLKHIDFCHLPGITFSLIINHWRDCGHPKLLCVLEGRYLISEDKRCHLRTLQTTLSSILRQPSERQAGVIIPILQMRKPSY